MSIRTLILKLLSLAVCLSILGIPASADMPGDKIRRPEGATVVPEHFLRRWDPLTIFFDSDRGPAEGGAEDHPERLLTIAPGHPGTYRWLDARTLQFRPIEPWAALTDYRVTVDGRTSDLTSLMEPPAAQFPSPHQRPRQLGSVSLGFAEPIDPTALAKMITVDLRAVAGGSTRLLTSDDFSIKTMDRTSGDGPDLFYYLVNFATPIPESTLAVLHLRLSNRAGLDVPLTDLRFQTDEGFRLQRIDCGSGYINSTVSDCSTRQSRELSLTFNAMAAAPDPLEVRKLIRLSPPVDNFAYRLEQLDYGQQLNRLVITGSFRSDTVYQLHLDDARIADTEGRPLKLGSERDYRFIFPEPRPALSWDAGQGIVERLGPQMVPLRGQGFESVDLRIHPVDALSRDFWPFPTRPVRIDENTEPPLAGTEPAPRTNGNPISAPELAERLKTLGSPSISELVPLPLKRGGTPAKFGIDLKPYLARIAGKDRPGHYLVGIRRIDGSKERDWMRIQVTDLALSSIEQWDQTHFFVTSLATGKPMAQASVRIEGQSWNNWVLVASGETDSTGHYIWNAPGSSGLDGLQAIRRIVVSKGDDTLVIDPDRRDQAYNGAYWAQGRSPWLQWTVEPVEDRKEVPQTLCHVFTERPIYRPDEPVHIKGFVRQHEGGRLSVKPASGTVVITGPDDEEWRLPVTLSKSGSFYQKFDKPTDATGDYKVRYESADQQSCGDFPFKKEAYRLPTFEVLLDGPEKTPLDSEFDVSATARYFAGGLLADRPLKWRVTQFPHTWNPPNRPGFLFSSDARFSGDREFRSTPVLQREVKTDVSGSAKLTLNPMIEPTAQPRRYFVEATVTGSDDIQVRTTQQIIALPPFVLGLKVPRYVAETEKLTPQMLALRYDGEPLAGLQVTVTLKKRRWNSILQASDFTQGTAKYVTEIVDDLISEQKITSAATPQDLALQTTGAGVYIVELTAEDRLGRTQTVAVDFFLGGSNTPVTWSRPPAQGITLTSDADSYVPGQTARLVIQSPFQSAEALVVTEEPDGRNRYDWLAITNGYGTAEIPIQKHYMPKVPVHVLLMRGRLANAVPTVASPFDLGKPTTLVGTAWLDVKPVQNIATLTMTAPTKARPAETIEVALKMTDETGKPLSGEATFWMVDQAILSLAKEQPLDPLPAFIRPYQTKLSARDTRNQAFGILPLMEDPGGDVAAEELGLDNISVRKNFTPVPIYLPNVPIGPDGTARISVKLPDSLTVFKLRAKVVSGADRFGFATGEIQVRQPIVAQPVLPRFVRTGDSFSAGVIGRLIENGGGAGLATIAVQGLTVSGDRQRPVQWTAGTPLHQTFPVTVPNVGYTEQGVLSRQNVTLRMGLQRTADKAGDAVEVILPLRPDRAPVVQRELVQIGPDKPLTREMPKLESRPGSLRRTVLAANEASLVRMAAAFDMLLAVPYGTTEQRIGQARAGLVWKLLGNGLDEDAAARRRDADIAAVLTQINQSTGENGLISPWPRGSGSVVLTAWSLQLIAEAEAADYQVDETLKNRLIQRLKQSLRTDSAQGLGYTERVWALAGLAAAGASDAGYLAELARRAQFLDQESLAQVVLLLAESPTPEPTLLKELVNRLWEGVRLQKVQDRTIYAGLAGQLAGPTIFASEARSLALTARAMAVAAPADPRIPVLTEALVRIGDSTGWGSANATAEALRTLIEIDGLDRTDGPPVTASVSGKPQPQPADTGALWRFSTTEAGTLKLETDSGLPVTARIETLSVPRAPGNQAAPETAGFVVSRTSLKVGADGLLVALQPQGNEHSVSLTVGDIIEDVAELITPEERFHVVLTLPLAAGMEPLNPNLATAPAEALTKGETTLRPDHVAYLDDQIIYFYERLPKGTYRFASRTRATIPGSFTQPPAAAEMIYNKGVRGTSAGARLVIAP
jgi:uncharacterized protein YfaS (alpha-2-macroglobulin family)